MVENSLWKRNKSIKHKGTLLFTIYCNCWASNVCYMLNTQFYVFILFDGFVHCKEWLRDGFKKKNSTNNVIYLLGCDKCPQQYIGETERMLKDRFLEHKGYANTNNQTKATGHHFNQKGHSVSNMKITVLEKVFNNNPQFRKQREKMYIQKFNTKYKGLNRINGG